MAVGLVGFREGTETVIPQEEQDLSIGEIYTTYMNQNIIGYKAFHEKQFFKEYETEEYSADDADNVLNSFNISADKRAGLIEDSDSIEELVNRAEYQQSNDKELATIQSHGVAGIAGSLGVSLIDLPGWAIGLGAGKAAGIGIKAYSLAGRGAKLAQASAGAASAIGATAALEHSLGNDLTPTQVAINGALGFTLGYTFAGNSVEHSPKANKIITGETPIQGFYPQENYVVKAMHSSSDQLKGSSNPEAVASGYKFTRSMGDVGPQLKNTTNDILDETNAILTKTEEEFEDYANAFKDSNGRALDDADQKEINRLGLDVDNGFNQEKKVRFKENIEASKESRDIEVATAKDSAEAEFLEANPEKYQNKVDSINESVDVKTQAIIDDYKTKTQKSSTKEKIEVHKSIEKIRVKRKKQYSQARAKLIKRNKKRIRESRRSILDSGKVEKEAVKIRAKYQDIIDSTAAVKGQRRKKATIAQHNSAKAALRQELKDSKDSILNKKKKELEDSFNADLKAEYSNINKVDDIQYKALKNRTFTEADYSIEIKAKTDKIVADAEREIKKLRKKILKDKKLEKQIKENTKAIKSKYNQEARTKSIKDSQKRLEDLIESIDPKYKDAVVLVARMKKEFGELIKKYDLDGMKDLDASFHWSRLYDAHLIAENPTGAIDAFKRAISSNFDEIDDDLAKAIDGKAREIVDNILANNGAIENIDIDKKLLVGVADNEKNIIGRNLKGRKLDLNGAELVDFMNNDIVANLTGYNHSVGGRLAMKRIFNIDKNFTASQYADNAKLTGKDRENFFSSNNQVLGINNIDPKSNSVSSRIVRNLNSVNFLNFGGWFGLNTLSDLGGIVNDFGFSRALKYTTGGIVEGLKNNPKGKSLARYIGHSAEGLTNNRAILYGADGAMTANRGKGELMLAKGSKWMSKLNGMNAVTDFMDDVTALASLDYILTGSGTKFTKSMNRLGLDDATINALRNNKKFATWSNGALDSVDLTKLDTTTRAALERGLRRAIRDVVLKGNALDSPEFLVEIFGSHALAQAMFQFMRFPVIAYNKLGRKMYHNFDAGDAIASAATSAVILGLITQAKDIGKAEPRYDLDTEEGQANTAVFVLERMPMLASLGLVQTQVDLLGRIMAAGRGEEYDSYRAGTNLGITWSRLQGLQQTGQRILDGTANERDVLEFKSFMSTNLYWLQPLNNIANDAIMDR